MLKSRRPGLNADVMISFVVPAHNEQTCLPATLAAIHESARVVGKPYEIIVVDDASTDATAEIALQHDARVVTVNHRQIAATRNSGARAAKGESIFFVDADTLAHPRTVAAALKAMDAGAVGGGGASMVAWREALPLYARLISFLGAVAPKLLGFTGGAFMFCTRAAFQATGGFNERLYWSEEGGFALALKREGRFYVPWQPVVTSGRRFRKTSAGQLFMGAVRLAFSPVEVFTQRKQVEKIWYDSNRTDDDVMPNSLGVRVSNGLAFLFLLAMMSGPVWNFIPRAWTPLDSPAGTLRVAIGILICHVTLICWPLAVVLSANLVRQKRGTGLIQSALLISFCIWQGFVSVRVVLWAWPAFGHWLAHWFKQ